MLSPGKLTSNGHAAERRDDLRPESHLTIVIPHFNQKTFLPRAVASVLSGKARGIDVIVVDDGSAGDTEPVLAALEAADSRITVIRRRTNEGVVTALNVGLATARGRYVTFLGADDFVMPDCYAALVRALEDNPTAALSCSQIALVGDDGSLRGIRPITPPSFRAGYLDPPTICRRIKSTDHWITSTTAVFRANLLRAAGGFDVSLGVFSDVIVARILAFEHGFVYVPGIRAVFRVAASTFSGSTLLDQDENVRQLAIARERLSSSTVGRLAPDYPDLFARRFRFSAARRQLVWNGRNADPDVIVKVAGGTESDAKALTAIRESIGFGAAGRALAVVWLTLRLRPFSLWLLLAHSLRNKATFIRNRRRIADWIRRMDDAGRRIGSTP
ncbi:glycosyltransferase family 2 protein [Bradyrhizobium diazoefficiens]|nr:glycosyltransferase family 2 protein [Bradyrhizobium diazoefficiens]MBR0848972.1 glycosyltransferase family 2 protein [Bradyrhizobium diazoefficiens]